MLFILRNLVLYEVSNERIYVEYREKHNRMHMGRLVMTYRDDVYDYDYDYE